MPRPREVESIFAEDHGLANIPTERYAGCRSLEGPKDHISKKYFSVSLLPKARTCSVRFQHTNTFQCQRMSGPKTRL